MRLFTLFFVAVFGLMTSALAEGERPRVDRYALGFTGELGVSVTLLGMGKKDDKEFLMQISGVNHDWDRKILKVKKVNQNTNGSNHNYQVQDGDKTYNAVVVRSRSYTLYLPGIKDSYRLSYDKGIARSVAPEHMLTKYLEKK
ncbi:MAG: hypothetical protein ACRBBN_16465 [Methyloligellaceae bacterium]